MQNNCVARSADERNIGFQPVRSAGVPPAVPPSPLSDPDSPGEGKPWYTIYPDSETNVLGLEAEPRLLLWNYTQDGRALGQREWVSHLKLESQGQSASPEGSVNKQFLTGVQTPAQPRHHFSRHVIQSDSRRPQNPAPRPFLLRKIEIPKSARSRLEKCSPSDSLWLMPSPRRAVHRAPRDSPVRPSLSPSIPPRAHWVLPREASHTRFLVGAEPRPSSAPWHRRGHPFHYLRNPLPLCSSQKPQPHFPKFPKFPSRPVFRLSFHISENPASTTFRVPRSAFRHSPSTFPPSRLMCPKTHPAKSPKSSV